MPEKGGMQMGTGTEQQYIEVGIAEQRYAVPIQDVQEIIRMQPCLPIPNAKSSIAGVINLRGDIVPVVSPGIRFQAAESPLARMMIVQLGDSTVAMTVDCVYRVTSYARIHSYDEGSRTDEYVTGIGLGEEDNQWVSLLNVATLLREEANRVQ